uniref:G-protein coupled receptors family 2 profile 1 domain-containing protein n=1 Tax=Pavo cristatus TaxID=9049 RepID=A0A8C9FEI5_PAVCR
EGDSKTGKGDEEAEDITDGSLSGVVQKWKEYQLQCLKYLYEAPPIVAEGKFCNRTFDNYACWPDGLPGTYVNVSCPWYLPWANTADILRPLCPFRFVCIQRFLTGAFHKTSLWRMGLHFCYAKQCLKLQGFVSQHHLPYNCNFCLLPLFESAVYKYGL